MVSFYPGPSQLDPNVSGYLSEALESGILSQNHRSPAFMQLYEDTLQTVRAYFDVPEDYSLYFVSSATECWEILSQDLGHLQNFHLYNGAFGEKGYTVNRALHPNTVKGLSFEPETIPEEKKYEAEVIHLTQNETSNGTQLSPDWLTAFRKHNPAAFIAIDATSSLAGVQLPMKAADIWFASVQKCFGLPSGMAVMLCSKRVVDYCKKQSTVHYNSIRNQEKQFENRQTTHTPNTLGIYLVNRLLKNRDKIVAIDQQLRTQAAVWYKVIADSYVFQPLINNTAVRSSTVITVSAEQALLQKIKQQANDRGFILGNGYGAFKDNTFRIANFPAHEAGDIQQLLQLISTFQ